MSIEKESLQYWSGRAPEYSKLHMESYASDKRGNFERQLVLALSQVKADAQAAGRRVRALDLGCGSGFMSLLLLDAGCEVIGVDFSCEMLEQARANVAGKGYEATFLQMRVQELDFPDASFDFVVSRNVTWVLEDVDRVYAQVMRVLAPGGVFLNLDANYGQGFREQEQRGETFSHPTQTQEQLLQRNELVSDLPISWVERPQWDIGVFWDLGASEVRCRRMGTGTNARGSQMFALEVHK
ncbi:MAG: class I SAM-dependent methyltransferase [Coriobacteriales bacterium]|nr:class I SAM-dependent methyltransferase [Coriobacteriales bacterium]